MKKLLLAFFAIVSAVSASAGGILSRDGDDEWIGIGTGAYQPGLLDYYGDEYPDLMPAAVYESSTREGVYRFVPSAPAAGVVVVYDIVVHTENPDKVWCEDATYYHGIMNLTVKHKVKEASGYDIPANYGKMTDGAITFTTPNSFMVVEMMGPKPSNTAGNFALYMPGKSPADDPVLNDTWQVMGKGKYVEGLLDCEYKAGRVWDVDIEQSVETPGCYRLKPYILGNPSCPNMPELTDTYVYVHAENDMEVYTTDFVLLNSQGVGYKIQHRAVMGSEPDYSYYGTLEDGIITFPANSHLAKIIGIPGAGSVLTNTSGRACIVLPGAKYEDYYIEINHPICLQSTGDGFCRVPLDIKYGDAVAAVTIAVEPGTVTLDQVDPQAYLASGTTLPRDFLPFIQNLNFPLVADQFKTNRWTMFLIAVDSKQTAKNVVVSTFFTPEKDEDWEDYATGKYTDLILGPTYSAFNETYTVSIQKKKGTSGQLRIVDPYLSHPKFGGSSYMSACADHHHYLYINADDPNYVYIEESAAGLDFDYGDVVLTSAVGSMLNQHMTVDAIKEKGAAAGQLIGDKVTFPANALYFFETKYKNYLLQDGDPGCLLEITDYVTGIEDITSDMEDAVYYDLQGMRVTNPARGGVFIKKQGNKTSKTYLK